jgi:D-glycero-D-manno-heptose 1,7-bisphosphate phosphatase
MTFMSRPALFLDRDGVINEDYGYVHTSENFKLIDGILDLVILANNLNYKVIVITNQAGIGRGYYTENDFLQLTRWMHRRFRAHNARIDAVYFCPYHPIFGVGRYKLDSEDRKPGAGMFLKAAAEHNIDLSESIMIGDKASDIEAGVAAGIKNLFHFNCGVAKDPAIKIDHLHEMIVYLNSGELTNRH